MTPGRAQVRRCARCGQPALVVLRVWQHKLAGITTGTETLELKCGRCGATVVLHPQSEIRALRLLAYVMIPAIFPTLLLLARARKKERAWIENPVVEGTASAVAPRTDPPRRRCACGAASRCFAIVRKGRWGSSLGVRSDYRCDRCSTKFVIHDARSIVFAGVIAAALSLAGALGVLHPPGAAVGAEQSNRWFGVGLCALGATCWLVLVRRIRTRAAHPVVDSDDGSVRKR